MQMIWLIYLLFLAGYVFSRGFYLLPGILILGLSFTLFSFYLFSEKLAQFNKVVISPSVVLLMSSLLSLILYGGLYQHYEWIKIVSLFTSFLVLILVLYFISEADIKIEKRLFIIIFIMHVILRVLMVMSSPNPKIDVFDYLKYGPLVLSHGQNPYSAMYHKIYPDMTPDYYNYFPSSLFLTMPFILLFGDPRIAIMTAELLGAYILYRIVTGKEGRILALIALGTPMSLYVLEESYIQPVVFFELALFGYLMIKKRMMLSAIVLGIILSTKQYVLVFPLYLVRYLRYWDMKWKLILRGVLVFAVIMIPFWVWNPNDFIHDTLMLQPSLLPRYEGLTFFSFLYQIFGYQYNLYFSLVLMLIFFMVSIFPDNHNKLAGVFFGLTYFLFAFFLFNKFSFVNYYYLVGQLLLLAIAMMNYKGKVAL